MTDELTVEFQSRLTKTEANVESLSTALRKMDTNISDHMRRLESLLVASQETHKIDIDNLKKIVDDKTKPQTDIVFKIISIALILVSIGGTLMSWRVSHHEHQNEKDMARMMKALEHVVDDVAHHHGDGHPHTQNAKLENLDQVVDEFRKWQMEHEGTVSAINATQNEVGQRNKEDIEWLKTWQQSRQSGSDKSNTAQAERLRALERAVFGKDE